MEKKRGQFEHTFLAGLLFWLSWAERERDHQCALLYAKSAPLCNIMMIIFCFLIYIPFLLLRESKNATWKRFLLYTYSVVILFCSCHRVRLSFSPKNFKKNKKQKNKKQKQNNFKIIFFVSFKNTFFWALWWLSFHFHDESRYVVVIFEYNTTISSSNSSLLYSPWSLEGISSSSQCAHR